MINHAPSQAVQRDESASLAWRTRSRRIVATFVVLLLLFYLSGVFAGVLAASGIAFGQSMSRYSIRQQDGTWLVAHRVVIGSERVVALRVGASGVPTDLAHPAQFPPAVPRLVVPRFASSAIETPAPAGTIRTVVSAGWPLPFVAGSAEEVFEGEISAMSPRSLRSQNGAIVIPSLFDWFPGMLGVVPIAPNAVNLVLASGATTALLWSAILGVRAIRRRFIIGPGCCTHCGHGLTEQQCRCPECGQAREVGAAQTPVKD
jgi:hypothetical protein